MNININAWCVSDSLPVRYALTMLSQNGHDMRTTSELNAWLFNYGWRLTDSSVDRMLCECDDLSICRISGADEQEISRAKRQLSARYPNPSRMYCPEYLSRINLTRFGRDEDYVRTLPDFNEWARSVLGDETDDDADMKAPEETPYERRTRMLNVSYEEAEERVNPEDPGFKDVYDWMKSYLAAIDFESCHIELSQSKRWVDVEFVCKNHYFVSVTGSLDSDRQDVYFSITRNRKNLITDNYKLDGLVAKINEALDIVEEEQSIWTL